jgi:hypothetical protein
LVENLKDGGHSENLSVDGRIILQWISGKVWEILDWMHLAQGSVADFREHENEPSDDVKGGDFLV